MKILNFSIWFILSFILLSLLGIVGAVVLGMIVAIFLLLRDKSKPVGKSFLLGNILGGGLGLITLLLAVLGLTIH